MANSKPFFNPLEPATEEVSTTSLKELFEVQTYQQTIGCLTYTATVTRPDIAAAVGTHT